ncbi:MAG: M23 family metallopeptidase [Patescibacteria group bacterium]|jgi:murein DD-endopeptidase MepM/ murein hydrolase activator NlpD
MLQKIAKRGQGLKSIKLTSRSITRSFDPRKTARSFSEYGKHWGLVALSVIVVFSSIRISAPAGTGGAANNNVHYRTIAEIASAATLAELGNPLYSNEEYTTNVDASGEYLFKTVQTETIISRSSRNETIKYIVREGESVGSLANDFGITALTLKYANGLSSNSLKVGQELKIPPIDGLYATVKRNDTLSSIANRYHIKVDDIVKYNGLTSGDPIFAGQELLIPGAIMPKATASTSSGSKVTVPGFNPTTYSGRFTWPTEAPTHYISQGYRSGHRAVDLNRLNGWGIYASAPGVVQIQKSRWGYGNLIIINHGDGWSTYYAHLSEFKVSAGQYVQQGQLIGIMGSTGRSTGPHLHFEIRQNDTPLNPLNYLPR